MNYDENCFSCSLIIPVLLLAKIHECHINHFSSIETLSPIKYHLFELSAMLQWRCIEREQDQLIEKSLLK